MASPSRTSCSRASPIVGAIRRSASRLRRSKAFPRIQDGDLRLQCGEGVDKPASGSRAHRRGAGIVDPRPGRPGFQPSEIAGFRAAVLIVRIHLPPAVSQANLRPHDARPPRVAAAQRRDPMTFLLVSSWQHPVAGTSRSRRRVHLILAPIQAPAGHHGPVVNTDVEYGSGGQSAIISGFQLSAMRRKPPLPKLLPRQIPIDG